MINENEALYFFLCEFTMRYPFFLQKGVKFFFSKNPKKNFFFKKILYIHKKRYVLNKQKFSSFVWTHGPYIETSLINENEAVYFFLCEFTMR